MVLIAARYNGLVAHCDNCGALIGYTPEDLWANGTFKCPQCNEWVQTSMVADYDGVVKEKQESDK